MQYMVVFLADISKKYYLCRYNVTIKLADRWKTMCYVNLDIICVITRLRLL